jgi:predicted O-methyltransferase YrrM
LCRFKGTLTGGDGVDDEGMTNKTIGISDELHAYVVEVGVREPELLARLRQETASMPQARMQIAPEQGAFLAMLVELIGARRCLEVGTFTGYSSTAIARALPADGRLTCCDVSQEWTDVARRYWAEAGVADKVDLRIAPAAETLDGLLDAGEEDAFDFAFVDADKTGYEGYYDRLLRLVRPGGLMAFDNTLWGGRVVDSAVDDADTVAIRAFNRRLANDDRVALSMLPVADGVTLARRR